jgi:hypothetical protein
MFVGWFSSDGGGRPGFGCCGLPFLIGPLLYCTMFGGVGDSRFLLLMVLAGLFVMFVLPRIMNFSAPAYAEDYDKRKNDDYLDKPKRDDQYIVGADGEVIDVIDEDPNRPPRADEY